jgi:hypothetical protein
MTRRALVNWGGSLVPRSALEPSLPLAPGACPDCGGLGVIAETIDPDRWDEMVPCQRCRHYCRQCKRWVTTEGHPHA